MHVHRFLIVDQMKYGVKKRWITSRKKSGGYDIIDVDGY
jgi:hypothetical protein